MLHPLDMPVVEREGGGGWSVTLRVTPTSNDTDSDDDLFYGECLDGEGPLEPVATSVPVARVFL